MNWRVKTYFFVSAVPPVAAVVLFFSFATSHFFFAWLCALIIILCMETRVQVGERLPRTTIFWTHLSSAVPFFLGLTALAFWTHPLWLETLTAILGLIAFSTGAILWYRGLESRMLHLSA